MEEILSWADDFVKKIATTADAAAVMVAVTERIKAAGIIAKVQYDDGGSFKERVVGLARNNEGAVGLALTNAAVLSIMPGHISSSPGDRSIKKIKFRIGGVKVDVTPTSIRMKNLSVIVEKVRDEVLQMISTLYVAVQRGGMIEKLLSRLPEVQLTTTDGTTHSEKVHAFDFKNGALTVYYESGDRFVATPDGMHLTTSSGTKDVESISLGTEARGDA